jgi:hypothetical protein
MLTVHTLVWCLRPVLLQEALGVQLAGWQQKLFSEYELPALTFSQYIMQNRSCLRPGPAELTVLLSSYVCKRLQSTHDALTVVNHAPTLLDVFPFPDICGAGGSA